MPGGSAATAAAVPFYIYPDAAYDQSAALECLPSWQFDDQAAEVALLALLRRHPARVLDPSKASLFVVPLMPYVSSGAGECLGETHEQRMARAASALRRSRTSHAVAATTTCSSPTPSARACLARG